MHRNTQKC